MKETWPLWECISVEAQAALMKFQFDTYGYRLEIPPESSFKIDTELEKLSEIDSLMRQAPKHQKRVS